MLAIQTQQVLTVVWLLRKLHLKPYNKLTQFETNLLLDRNWTWHFDKILLKMEVHRDSYGQKTYNNLYRLGASIFRYSLKNRADLEHWK